ncbi:MAG: ribonuclease HII [Patescibacteria group bacterium]|jgi:ribonuclease HII|nr:ribonuclease HII [Patescibacteria group bacterium]
MINLNKENNLNYRSFIGVDEVGRGCLAGPVVSAAVFVSKEQIGEIAEINDSKLVSKKKRDILYLEIINNYPFSIGLVSNIQIDKLNILNASLLSMKRALDKIKHKSEIVLVDGTYKIPGFLEKQQTQIKGDQNFYSIAAASIVAKVVRDKMMEVYSKKFPNYSFYQHKGYGTKLHKAEIVKFGTCNIHRKSFKLN